MTDEEGGQLEPEPALEEAVQNQPEVEGPAIEQRFPEAPRRSWKKPVGAVAVVAGLAFMGYSFATRPSTGAETTENTEDPGEPESPASKPNTGIPAVAGPEVYGNISVNADKTVYTFEGSNGTFMHFTFSPTWYSAQFGDQRVGSKTNPFHAYRSDTPGEMSVLYWDGGNKNFIIARFKNSKGKPKTIRVYNKEGAFVKSYTRGLGVDGGYAKALQRFEHSLISATQRLRKGNLTDLLR